MDTLWRTARTVTDLGRLTADWLDGDIPAIPGYCDDRPDSETHHLIPTLTRICRAGYATTNSQPGHGRVAGHDGRIYEQRAAVTGWCCDDRLLARMRAEARAAGLLVIATRPGQRQRGSIPVTRADGRPVTDFGWSPGHRRMILWDWSGAGGISGAARRALRAAVILTVVDPVWGRDAVLWPALDRATTRTPAAPYASPEPRAAHELTSAATQERIR